MKTKEEYINEYITRHKLLPKGSKVVIIYPKCDEFGQIGEIISHFIKVNDMFWDYEILLDNGRTVHFDRSLIEAI